MRIAVIQTRCKREMKGIFNIFSFCKRVAYIRKSYEGFDVLYAKIYGKNDSFLQGIEKKLRNISDIVVSDKDFMSVNSNEFFLKIALHIYKKTIAGEDIKPYKQKLLVCDEDLSALNNDVLERLCFWCSECYVYSDNTEAAEKLCLHMREKCGAAFDVCNNRINVSAFDVVFDLDNRYMKIGSNILINSFVFGISDISETINTQEIDLAAVLYNKGLNVKFLKLNGRKAIFTVA